MPLCGVRPPCRGEVSRSEVPVLALVRMRRGLRLHGREPLLRFLPLRLIAGCPSRSGLHDEPGREAVRSFISGGTSMEYVIGSLLAVGVCGFVTLLGLDRDRALYPAMAIVVASYNGLFAVISGSTGVLFHELPSIAVFVLMASIGFRINLWYAVGALALHGLFDGFHGQLIANPGVPAGWPGFCLAFDVVAAIWLAGTLLCSRVEAKPRPRHPLPA